MAAESWAIAENAWALACIEATAAGLGRRRRERLRIGG